MRRRTRVHLYVVSHSVPISQLVRVYLRGPEVQARCSRWLVAEQTSLEAWCCVLRNLVGGGKQFKIDIKLRRSQSNFDVRRPESRGVAKSWQSSSRSSS